MVKPCSKVTLFVILDDAPRTPADALEAKGVVKRGARVEQETLAGCRIKGVVVAPTEIGARILALRCGGGVLSVDDNPLA